MNTNTEYKKTLTKMFLLESLGESLYKALYSKAVSNERASIYKRLSVNETETADSIADELRNLGFSVPTIRKFILKVTSLIIFSVLPRIKLEKLLKRAIRKSYFKSWFNRYHEYNQDFWQSMLDHETLQSKLLNS
ncbi:MAG: amidohydrolase [Candidatus Brocadiaceae bacterium]|nr:amidohydrolase [Candidatus Brocadiaceae bacterium]